MMPAPMAEYSEIISLIGRIGIVTAVIVVASYAYWKFFPSNLDH